MPTQSELVEAAKRWNTPNHAAYALCEDDEYYLPTLSMEDRTVLANAYARELDHTPITPEMLVADGWLNHVENRFRHPSYDKQLFAVITAGNHNYRFECRNATVFMTRMGELRTALRLMGGA